MRKCGAHCRGGAAAQVQSLRPLRPDGDGGVRGLAGGVWQHAALQAGRGGFQERCIPSLPRFFAPVVPSGCSSTVKPPRRCEHFHSALRLPRLALLTALSFIKFGAALSECPTSRAAARSAYLRGTGRQLRGAAQRRGTAVVVVVVARETKFLTIIFLRFVIVRYVYV